jgi:hypothetical protein
MDMKSTKEFRRFKEIEYYQKSSDSQYYLLPFKFIPLSDTKELLVSTVGDYLIVPRGSAHRIANRELDRSESLYADLSASFFVSETPILHHFTSLLSL